ncbi:hypothetical protein LLG96_08615 [bacterium]|nr:hypothetical protein [bacterium]
MSTFECAYCGQFKAATDDHVPPKSIFKDPKPLELPTVKSCAQCNQGASDDDEYFRDTVVKYYAVADKPQAKDQLAAMYRAATKSKKRKYAERTLSSFFKIEVISSAGIYLGTVPAYRIDTVRFNRVVIRYIKGLYRYDTGTRLPDDRHIEVISDPDTIHQKRQQVEQLLAGSESKNIQEGVFWYAWGQAVDNPAASFWLLVFYDAFPIIAVIN